MAKSALFLLLILTLSQVYGETFVLKSPDGKNRLTIKVDDELTYEIQRDNKIIMDHSPIKIEWDNGIDMRREQLRIKKVRRDKKKGSVKMVVGPAQKLPYAYNEVHIIFEEESK